MDQTTDPGLDYLSERIDTPLTVKRLKELTNDLPEDALVNFVAIRYGAESVMVVRRNDRVGIYDFENALKVIADYE